MKTSEHVNEIGKAMACVQGEMRPAIKDSNNPFFKSKYSNLTSVWDSIREPLMKNQISVFQDVFTTEHGVSVTTKLVHASGQWIDFGPLEIPLSKRDAQSIGSATSYAKRYSLSAACGVVTDDMDDDAEIAMNRNGKPEKVKEEKKEQPKSEPVPITKQQIKELYDLSEICAPDYFSKIMKYLQESGVKTLEDIMSDRYEKIVAGMRANAEKYQKGK